MLELLGLELPISDMFILQILETCKPKKQQLKEEKRRERRGIKFFFKTLDIAPLQKL